MFGTYTVAFGIGVFCATIYILFGLSLRNSTTNVNAQSAGNWLLAIGFFLAVGCAYIYYKAIGL
jgi:hypothetical protein